MPTSAQPAKHSKPSCTVCGNGLIAVAAFICPNDSSKSAAAGGEEAQSDLLVPTKANPNSRDQRSLNGPISPLKGESMPVSCSDLLVVGFSSLAPITLTLDACCIIMTPLLGLSCVFLPWQFQMCSDSLLILFALTVEKSNGAGANGPISPSRQPKQGVLRVVVLDDTYGCVQHVEDLPRADLGPELDAPFSASAQPQHLHVS